MSNKAPLSQRIGGAFDVGPNPKDPIAAMGYYTGRTLLLGLSLIVGAVMLPAKIVRRLFVK